LEKVMGLLRACAAAAAAVVAIHVVWVVRPISSLGRYQEPEPAEVTRSRLVARQALEARVEFWKAEERLRRAEDDLLSNRLRHMLAAADAEKARERSLAAETDVGEHPVGR
jgi:hypothetical protein